MILFALFSNLERLIKGFLKFLLVWGFMHIMASKISIYYTRFFVKVFCENSESKKLRIVHDASAVENIRNLSMNGVSFFLDQVLS